jgi:hypothetical protein
MPARRNIRFLAVLCAVSLGLTAAAFGASGPQRKPSTAPKPAPGNGCATCVEKRAVLDPGLFTDTRIYESEVAPAYQVARRIPATIDRLHCFCECAENPQFHHKTLLTCFTDKHAAGCGICVREALTAAELKEKGASDDEIVVTVESLFKTDGHPPTHPSGK